MPKFKDIVAAIQKQTARKRADLVRAQQEIDRLLEPYQRFRELSAQVAEIQETARIGESLIVNCPVKLNPFADAFNPRYRDDKVDLEGGEPVDVDEFDLSNFSLWKIMRELLRQVPEIRVYELEAHLKMFGVKANRSAIESALKTHSREFKVSRRSREKFVALK